MLKTNWVRCIWAICIMTGKSFYTSSLKLEMANIRIQFLFTWKSRSLPRLSPDYKGVLELRCLQGYHHQ